MRDIVVVGSLNVDLSFRAERIPEPGETVPGHALQVGPGGKGLNQAVAAARLGGRVHMVGRVGDDDFARIPLAALRENGVDSTYVEALDSCETGTAGIVVQDDGQNAITVVGGANHALRSEHVRDAVAAFRASSVLLVQLECRDEAVRCSLELAREHGMLTILDPAPVRELPDDLLRLVDVLTPNEVEASRLSGTEVSDIESAALAGRRLHDRSQGDVIVTLGSEGCVWVSTTGFEHVPAPRVAVVDTTGAGDAFNGGLAVALAAEEPLSRALRNGVLAGTAATLKTGAAISMPTAEDLARLAGDTDALVPAASGEVSPSSGR